MIDQEATQDLEGDTIMGLGVLGMQVTPQENANK